jgi:hypothetical protein
VSLGVGRAGNGNNDTARIEAFSDGVFAIAITLLVLEIQVPHAEEGASLFDALLGLWPSYLAYAISFLQIGVVWANHHNRFGYIARSDHVLLFLSERTHRRARLRTTLPAALLSRPQPHRVSLQQDKRHLAKSGGQKPGGTDRSDGPRARCDHPSGCAKLFQTLRIPITGATIVTIAVVYHLHWFGPSG